jgi:hypothetical protein
MRVVQQSRVSGTKKKKKNERLKEERVRKTTDLNSIQASLSFLLLLGARSLESVT